MSLDGMVTDLRRALQSVVCSSGMTLLVIGTLGLAMAANISVCLLLAAFFPACSASRLDPSVTLRQE